VPRHRHGAQANLAVYGWNGNDQTRFNVGGTPGLTAEADYDSWTGGLRASTGRNFLYGPAMGADHFQLTPQLFSEYVHFHRDGYAETGAGGANLTTGSASQTILNAGISLQAEWTFVMENGGKLKPDLHASYKYDLIGDSADTFVSFAAGGSTFAVDGVDPARSAFGIGAGVKFFDTSGWDFTANYDYTFKDEYNAHSGFVRAAYEF
jgi:outer membrane autotransporter protein